MQEPEWFREQGNTIPVDNQRTQLELRPYAYAWLEAYD
jgi:hypothetical protein